MKAVARRIPLSLYRRIHALVPLVCVDLVVIGHLRGKRYFLLVRRKNQPERGKWWFPGGRIFKNERLHAAALRKLKEETGLKGSVKAPLGIYEYFSRIGYFPGMSSHMLAVVYLAAVSARDKIALDFQSSDKKWFNKINPKWHPYLKEKLRAAGFK